MTTLNLQIGAGPDDGVAGGGFYDPGGVSLLFRSDIPLHNWYRFTGVGALTGATINSATLNWGIIFGDGPNTGVVHIYAEDVAAPVAVASEADFFAKARTAVYFWGQAAIFWSAGSPNIASVIQELIDNHGSISAIQILMHAIAGIYISNFVSYELNPALAVRLDIDFTPPPTFTSTNPASPNESNTLRVLGVAEAGSTVQLYTDKDCTIPIGLPTPAADFASPGIQVTVPDWSTTTFHAISTGAFTSPCSTDSITYINLVPSVVIGLLAICAVLRLDPWTLISPSGFLNIMELVLASGFVPDPDAEDLTLEDMARETTALVPSGFIRDPDGSHLWDL